MTELENHLLNALKRLEKQFNEQHKASEDTQFALRMMFEHTSEENKNLRHQVGSLSEQLQQFAKLYNSNRL